MIQEKIAKLAHRSIEDQITTLELNEEFKQLAIASKYSLEEIKGLFTDFVFFLEKFRIKDIKSEVKSC